MQESLLPQLDCYEIEANSKVTQQWQTLFCWILGWFNVLLLLIDFGRSVWSLHLVQLDISLNAQSSPFWFSLELFSI